MKVDPVVVLVLSLVFIFSVVALHSTSLIPYTDAQFHTIPTMNLKLTKARNNSHRKAHPQILCLDQPHCDSERGGGERRQLGWKETDVHCRRSETDKRQRESKKPTQKKHRKIIWVPFDGVACVDGVVFGTCDCDRSIRYTEAGTMEKEKKHLLVLVL